MKPVLKYFAAVLAIGAFLASGCRKEEHHDYSNRKLLIVYSAGFNNLSRQLTNDLEDLSACLPQRSEEDSYKVLVVSHSTKYPSDYSAATCPVVYEYYLDGENVVRDTVYRFPQGSSLTDPQVFNSALTFIRDKYPAKEYGLLATSHGSGWTPDDYYTFPEYDEEEMIWNSPALRYAPQDPILMEYRSENPSVKSAGATYSSSSSRYTSINVPEFVAAIPMKLKYVLFDMCLMGGVEVAYQMRGKVSYVVFSPMEIMSEGLQYRKLLDRLFLSPEADLASVCQDTYDYYSSASSPYCTISLVDCSRMGPLAEVCSRIVSSHREALDKLDCYGVQRYFRAGRHFFYDLEDVLIKAGITQQEKKELEDALSWCVLYKAATPYGVFREFRIDNFCGMSMCVPKMCSSYLKDYYKVYDWNKATALVK